MKKILVSVFLLVVGCTCSVYGGGRNFYDEVGSLTNWSDVTAYVRSLSTNEVWLLADQVRDKQGKWQGHAAAVLLSLYFGENWERNTPNVAEVLRLIQDRRLNPELRGALAASGFEIGRAWEIGARLQYFDSVVSLFDERDIPASEKTRMAEYSYRAFSRCLSEVRSLSDTNAMKTVLLNTCHTRAQGMMKTLSATVEENPKEQAGGAMARALEDYANIYEHADFPRSPQLQETVDEAAKARSVLQQYRKK